jgi:transposase
MSRHPLRIVVSRQDRKELDALLSGGIQPVRVTLRALSLLHLADGTAAPAVARALKKLTAKAVRVIGHRYQQGGLHRALYEKARPGAKQLLSASEKQRIIAMVCSDPPAGRARWTVRLIVEEAIKTKAGAPCRSRNHPHPPPKPRTAAVAGKKCGAWPTSPTSI